MRTAPNRQEYSSDGGREDRRRAAYEAAALALFGTRALSQRLSATQRGALISDEPDTIGLVEEGRA